MAVRTDAMIFCDKCRTHYYPEHRCNCKPEVSGIAEYDELVQLYIKKQITLDSFACQLWNKAYKCGKEEKETL